MGVNKAIILIQCRYDSTRCEGKILRKLTPFMTCLEYLVDRLEKTNYNCKVATSWRKQDRPIVNHVINLRKTYLTLLGVFTGSYKNIARRLYEASEGYEYIIRVTGDDLFVDVGLLNKLADKTIEGNFDYGYTKDLIRGCDCDIIKREALENVMKEYDTSDFESIEFLLKNKKYTNCYLELPESYKNNQISLDTEDDWKLINTVFPRLSAITHNFNTFEIVEYFSRHMFLASINSRPLVTVYTVFKDYPVYWLEKAIDSLNKQTFLNFEFILIDYGSKQLHNFKRYINDKNIETYCLEDMAFTEAISFAMKKASGKYIMRLDADDILKPNALEQMVDYLIRNDFYSMVIPNYDAIDKDGNLRESNIDGELLNLPTCALIELKKYKYIDFFKKQDCRDGTSLTEMFKKYDFLIGYLKEPLFYYRYNEDSITRGKFTKEEIEQIDNQIRG